MTAVVSATMVRVHGRLAPVTLRVDAGTIHAVRGGNGTGKSTFLDCVLGLTTFEGALELNAATMAVVPQRIDVASAASLTVLELFAASKKQRPSWLGIGTNFRRATLEALEPLGAGELVDRQLARLSGGELRRVLLALALSERPALLLLDEPEAGLDAGAREALLKELDAAKQRGQAILWVSHDDAAVQALATSQTRLVVP